MGNNFNAYESFEDLFNSNFLQLLSSYSDSNQSYFRGQLSGILSMALLSNIIDDTLCSKLDKLVYTLYD